MRDIPFGLRASGALVVAFLVLCHAPAHTKEAAQTPSLATSYQTAYARIRDEGLSRSQVMDYATELIDGIGPRLTGSPNLRKAIDWARGRLTQMGLSRVRAESWGEFGVGWEQRNVSVRMVAPDTAVFIAQAAPWSPATPGPVTADVRAVGGSRTRRRSQAIAARCAVGSCCSPARQGRLTSSSSTNRCSPGSTMRSLRRIRACR